MKTVLILIFSSFCILQAQIVPDSLVYDWSESGFPQPFPSPKTIVPLTDYQSGESTHEDWTDAFLRAVESLEGKQGVIYFPPGDYFFHSTLYLPDSCIIRGAGADSTRLFFDLEGKSGDCFFIGNYSQVAFDTIPVPCKKGFSEVAGPFLFRYSPGAYIEITQDNGDWDVMPAAWAKNCTGQFARVAEIGDSALMLDQALRLDFEPTLFARIRPVAPRQMVGIECLAIIRTDTPAVAPLYNIHFNYANRCWVKGVESIRSSGSHILADASSEITITGSYFHESVAYDGVGTHGYGVTLIQHSTRIRVEDNIFRHLRHAMMVKQGAN
ncbi:MAG: hypothetical protein R3C61_09460 [Bacteroidia bacterium]